MKTTNLGDSGYVIFKASKEGEKLVLTNVFRSKEQQYRFNFPYQCGTGCDLPWEAFDNEHKIEAGKDFVVMGSDGLFDNLYDKDISDCLYQQIELKKNIDELGDFKLKSVDETASCIGNKAYQLSHDRRYLSPFAKGAREARVRFMGGKTDDITVIVSQIVRS